MTAARVHRCENQTDDAIDLAVLEVTMSAPLSLAWSWYDDRELLGIFTRCCALEDRMLAAGLCLTCGRHLPSARLLGAA